MEVNGRIVSQMSNQISSMFHCFVLDGHHPEVPSSRDSQGHLIWQVPLVHPGLFETACRQQGRLRKEHMERSDRVNRQAAMRPTTWATARLSELVRAAP